MRLKIKDHIEDFCSVFGDDGSKMNCIYITKKIRVLERKHVVDLMATVPLRYCYTN
jgi:hypothetical protein